MGQNPPIKHIIDAVLDRFLETRPGRTFGISEIVAAATDLGLELSPGDIKLIPEALKARPDVIAAAIAGGRWEFGRDLPPRSRTLGQ